MVEKLDAHRRTRWDSERKRLNGPTAESRFLGGREDSVVVNLDVRNSDGQEQPSSCCFVLPFPCIWLSVSKWHGARISKADSKMEAMTTSIQETQEGTGVVGGLKTRHVFHQAQ